MSAALSSAAPSAATSKGRRQFTILPGQKVTTWGHSGTGKTVFMTKLLGGVPRRCPVVAIDPKNHMQPPTPEWQVVRELPDLWERHIASEKNPKYLRLIVRPFPEGSPYPGSRVRYAPLNDLYTRIWNASYSTEAGREPLPHEQVTVYFDDLQELVDEHRASPEMRRLWNMGRARKISPWLSTLRPSRVPREAFAEADHMLMFWLRDRKDKERSRELVGSDFVLQPAGPGPYDLWYLPPGVNEVPIAIEQGNPDGKVWGQ